MDKKVGNKLKMLIGNYTKNSRPTNFYFATMVTPTQIQLDNSQGPIPESLCIIPERLRKPYTVKIEGTYHDEQHLGEMIIDDTLKTGERVVVLQKPGGQKYLILGRL